MSVCGSTVSTGAGVGCYSPASPDVRQDRVTHAQSGPCRPFSGMPHSAVASWLAGVHAAGNDTPEPATVTHGDRNASSSLVAPALKLAKGIDARDKTALAKYLKQTAQGDIRVKRKSFDSVIGSIDGSADVVIVVSPAGHVLKVFTKEEHGQWMMRNVGDAPGDRAVECKPSEFLNRYSSPHSYGLRVKVIEGIRLDGVRFTGVQPEERPEEREEH